MLRGTITPPTSLGRDLEGLANRLDEAYFELSETDGGDPRLAEEATRLFSQARAASSLAFALAADDDDLHEAIYEAVMAMHDPNEIIRLLDDVLRQGD